jgi:hypothetical protein
MFKQPPQPRTHTPDIYADDPEIQAAREALRANRGALRCAGEAVMNAATKALEATPLRGTRILMRPDVKDDSDEAPTTDSAIMRQRTEKLRRSREADKDGWARVKRTACIVTEQAEEITGSLSSIALGAFGANLPPPGGGSGGATRSPA